MPPNGNTSNNSNQKLEHGDLKSPHNVLRITFGRNPAPRALVPGTPAFPWPCTDTTLPAHFQSLFTGCASVDLATAPWCHPDNLQQVYGVFIPSAAQVTAAFKTRAYTKRGMGGKKGGGGNAEAEGPTRDIPILLAIPGLKPCHLKDGDLYSTKKPLRFAMFSSLGLVFDADTGHLALGACAICNKKKVKCPLYGYTMFPIQASAAGSDRHVHLSKLKDEADIDPRYVETQNHDDQYLSAHEYFAFVPSDSDEEDEDGFDGNRDSDSEASYEPDDIEEIIVPFGPSTHTRSKGSLITSKELQPKSAPAKRPASSTPDGTEDGSPPKKKTTATATKRASAAAWISAAPESPVPAPAAGDTGHQTGGAQSIPSHPPPSHQPADKLSTAATAPHAEAFPSQRLGNNRLTDRDATIQQLRINLEDAHAAAGAALRQVETFAAEQDGLAPLQERNAELEKRNGELESQLASREEEWAKFRSEMGKMEGKLASSEEEQAKLRSENCKLQAKLDCVYSVFRI